MKVWASLRLWDRPDQGRAVARAITPPKLNCEVILLYDEEERAVDPDQFTRADRRDQAQAGLNAVTFP